MLTINMIPEKLDHWYEKIKNNSNARNVASMAINLEIKNIQKIKMKRRKLYESKKMKIKQKI